MGIYIKGMEMPKDDYVVMTLYPSGNCYLYYKGCGGIAKKAEVIEVPTPHRRLIEEPKQLSFAGLPYISPTDFIGTAEYFLDQIKSMPAVIEAEVEHE